jgi:hypothetical protein
MAALACPSWPPTSRLLDRGIAASLYCPLCHFPAALPPASYEQDQGPAPEAGPSERAVRVGAMALGIMSRLIQVVRMLHQVGSPPAAHESKMAHALPAALA